MRSLSKQLWDSSIARKVRLKIKGISQHAATAVTTVQSQRTRVSIWDNNGLGDRMITRQLALGWECYFRTHGDPELGNIAIIGGVWEPSFKIPTPDHLIYWWWSMGRRDDWLEFFTKHFSIRPSLICCLSQDCIRTATALGYSTLYLPLAAGNEFQPGSAVRRGIGYAGSRGHKDDGQTNAIVRPFMESALCPLEWVDDLTTASELAAFYNRKQVALGMTERFQEEAGMVNNRVFEALATETPLIVYRHRNISETLGIGQYPYQSSCPHETAWLAEDLARRPEQHREFLREISQHIRKRHTYENRITALCEHLLQK